MPLVVENPPAAEPVLFDRDGRRHSNTTIPRKGEALPHMYSITGISDDGTPMGYRHSGAGVA